MSEPNDVIEMCREELARDDLVEVMLATVSKSGRIKVTYSNAAEIRRARMLALEAYQVLVEESKKK